MTLLMHSADTGGNADIRRLTRILANAYSNAIRHNASTFNLESEDLGLESASIRLSSLIAREIAGACGNTVQSASSSEHDCVLEERSGDLKDLSDMLSHAASYLENQSRMAERSSSTLHQLHLGYLEHLYRTVFALTGVYFDRPQSETYLKAAHEQINLARASLQKENQLCSCDDQKYSRTLDELARLDDAVLAISLKE